MIILSHELPTDFRVSDEKLPPPCWCGGMVWYRRKDGKLDYTPHNLEAHGL